VKLSRLYLLVLAVCLVSSSYLIQSTIYKPASTSQAAANYSQVKVQICVNSSHSRQLDVAVISGELAKGSKGLISAREDFEIGDCFSARISLRPSSYFERYTFRGSLREVSGPVRHASQLKLVNEIRGNFKQLQGDPSNLVAGLAVGMDEGLSEEFVKSMKLTGLTHLTAVSGANCAIVIGLVWVLLRRFPIHKTVRTAIALVALSCYVVLVGPQPSVLRAAFMMAVVFVSLELGRRVWLPRALVLGSVILLIVDPWLLSDYGFWLSALATYGLVALTPNISEHLENWLPKPIALVLAATIAAQLWCIPILASLQGGFTTYSVLANLLVEPLVAVITVLGLAASIFGVFMPILFTPSMTIAGWFASWIVFLAKSFSSLPANLLPLPSGLIGSLILIGLVAVYTFGVVKHRSFLAVLLCVSLVAGWVVGGAHRAIGDLNWPPADWTVSSCDVGQGDATVIKSRGEIALVDTGKDPELIDRCLDRLKIQQIDLLVLTHFDADHVAGLAGALRGRSVLTSLISKFPDDRPLATIDRELLVRVSNKVIPADLNLSGELGAYRWQVISSLGEQASTSNEGSLGILFESSTLAIYTLADLNEFAQCQIQLQRPSTPVIVKVSHHGSADQCPKLYNSLRPDLALISVGAGNAYGHPTKRALELLESSGSSVFRTDESGSISISQNTSTLGLSVSLSG
jgi:competence protein ComEC